MLCSLWCKASFFDDWEKERERERERERDRESIALNAALTLVQFFLGDWEN